MYKNTPIGYNKSRRGFNMKKKIWIIACVFVFILFIILGLKDDKEIRVRVIPNSNNSEDLQVKENVKNLTILYLKDQIDDTYDKTFNNISNSYSTLEQSIEDALAVHVRVSFEEHILYNKTYNDIALKDEKCYCLYVVIEEGTGDNWWGSVFPKFLSVSSTEEVEYKSFLYEWYKRMIG